MAVCTNITVDLNVNGLAFITAAQVDGGSYDNCGGSPTRSIDQSIFGCGDIGSNTVILTVVDVCGNTNTCTAIVTVRDVRPPTINCPATVTANANAGQCSATNVPLGTATASDNCGVLTTTNNAPGSFPVGTNFVTWTATDVSGNSASCTQLVVVVDNQPPTINCPANIVTSTTAGSCVASNVSLGSPTAADNCAVASVVNNAPIAFPVGTNFVAWTATDVHGNSASCTQRVIVADTELPVITCPADVIVTNPAGQCCASAVALGTPAASDNCAVASVVSNAPSSYPIGTNLVTWTATDVHGNSASCVQQVIVVLTNPDADSDGDGLSDLTECQIGSDPNDNTSGFWVVGNEVIADDVKLTWLTIGGSTNVIQTATPIINGNYTNNYINLGTVIVPGTGAVITNWVDYGGVTNDPSRFYRIRLQPGPGCLP